MRMSCPVVLFGYARTDSALCDVSEIKTEEEEKEKGRTTTDPGRRVIYGRVFARTDKFRPVFFSSSQTQGTHIYMYTCADTYKRDGYWVPPFSPYSYSAKLC